MDSAVSIIKKKKISLTNSCIVIMYLAAFMAFSFPQFNIITSAIIAGTMILISVSKKYYVVFPLAIIANDALGSFFFEGISIFYLFIIMPIVWIVSSKRVYIKQRSFIGIVIALLLSIQLYLSGFLGLERTIITFFLAGWFLIIMDNIERRQDTLSDFFFHMTISITLIALHSFIYQGFGLDSIGRVGLIGLGSVMDPNYSALILNCGLSLLLFQRSHSSLRLIMGIIIFFAIIRTGSLTGMLCIMIILIIFALKDRSLGKKVRRVMIILLGVILVFGIIMSGASIIENAYIEFIVNRIHKIIAEISLLDFNSATSGRMEIAQIKLQYFFGQSFFGFLFGGNSLFVGAPFVSHNTYIDLLLRFGIVGTLFIIIII